VPFGGPNSTNPAFRTSGFQITSSLKMFWFYNALQTRIHSYPMQTPSEPILALQGIRKRHGAHEVLKGIDLEVARGEFFSLLGPSGCGKTSLLRLVAGFDVPDAGRVRLDGQDATHKPVQERNVNLVFQNYALFPHMTVRDNVAFGLRMQRMSKDGIDRRVDETLALVRMSELGGRLPGQLSGGQQQRVALARALAPHPSLLLLDEPMGALDAGLRQEMQRELRALQKQLGLTFVHVTHDQDEAMALSDRIAILREGELLQVGTPEDVYSRPATREVAEFFPEANFFAATLDGVDAAGTPLALCPELGAQVRLEKNLAKDAVGHVELHLRPEALTLIPFDSPDAASPQRIDSSRRRACVREMSYLGREVRYVVEFTSGLRAVVSLPTRAGVAGGFSQPRSFAVGDPVQLRLVGDSAHALGKKGTAARRRSEP
jgi:spermidine/putrescine transport system ATP-binding protein